MFAMEGISVLPLCDTTICKGVRNPLKKSCIPYEGDDINSRRIISVSQEIHERKHDVGGDFRKFDGNDVNGLD